MEHLFFIEIISREKCYLYVCSFACLSYNALGKFNDRAALHYGYLSMFLAGIDTKVKKRVPCDQSRICYQINW